LQTSQGYIIRILQHFATKLWNITNLLMLFQAVMKFLSRLVEFKILVNWGMVQLEEGIGAIFYQHFHCIDSNIQTSKKTRYYNSHQLKRITTSITFFPYSILETDCLIAVGIEPTGPMVYRLSTTLSVLYLI
jgi:hypothetical protein